MIIESSWTCRDILARTLYPTMHTAISIKVVHEQSAKVEYERERLLGIALKINLLFDSVSALLVDNLN